LRSFTARSGCFVPEKTPTCQAPVGVTGFLKKGCGTTIQLTLGYCAFSVFASYEGARYMASLPV